MGAHIGPPVNHITGRRHTLGFRGATALFGHLGIEWDLLAASDDELAAVADIVAVYKAHRALLHTGRLWRLEADAPDIAASMVVADDRYAALVSIAQLVTPTASTPGRLRLAGLHPDLVYEVAVVSGVGDRLGDHASVPLHGSTPGCRHRAPT